MSKWMPFFYLVLQFLSQDAVARFIKEDADKLDSDAEIGTEYYNDVASYRYPISWNRRWQRGRRGYRVNAGSLNQKSLLYEDDLILTSGEPIAAEISFKQSRRESVDDIRMRRQMGVTWTESWFSMGVVGDGGSEKEFGDLGLIAGLFGAGDSKLDVTYWSTDHYYGEKNQESMAQIARSSYTLNLVGQVSFGPHYLAKIVYDYDHPLRWKRPVMGYTYARGYRFIKMFLEKKSKSRSFYLDVDALRKSESFVSNLAAGVASRPSESMDRKVSQSRVGTVDVSGDTTRHIELAYVVRDYTRYGLDDSGDQTSIHNLWDTGFTFTNHTPLNTSAIHYWQWGAHINYARLRSPGLQASTEIKLQLGFDWRVNDDSRCFVNTTWDLDEIYRNAPYNKRPFKPWGGGNLQFMMVL